MFFCYIYALIFKHWSIFITQRDFGQVVIERRLHQSIIMENQVEDKELSKPHLRVLWRFTRICERSSMASPFRYRYIQDMDFQYHILYYSILMDWCLLFFSSAQHLVIYNLKGTIWKTFYVLSVSYTRGNISPTFLFAKSVERAEMTNLNWLKSSERFLHSSMAWGPCNPLVLVHWVSQVWSHAVDNKEIMSYFLAVARFMEKLILFFKKIWHLQTQSKTMTLMTMVSLCE